MKVVLDRRIKMSEFTVGDWIIDGKKLCDSMEDCDRGLHQGMSLDEIKAKKVYGETAIPAGHYKIKMTYSPKYKRMMPQVMDVPGFTGIRVHSGNSSKDSLGCILLGEHKPPRLNCTEKGRYDRERGWIDPIKFTDKELREMNWVSNSRANVQLFEQLLIKAGGECDLEVKS